MPSMLTADQAPLLYLRGAIPVWLANLRNVNDGTDRRTSDESPYSSPSSLDHDETSLFPHASDAARDNLDSTTLVATLSTDARLQTSSHVEPPLPRTNNKRKRDSISSPSEDTPAIKNRYRAQNCIVVIYDADAQKIFEDMVISISRVRGTIRKLRTPSFSPPPCPLDPSCLSPDQDDEPTLSAHLERTLRPSQKVIAPPLSWSLTRTDKDLEQISDICETAAFQLLRDGDCRHECLEIGERLKSLLQLCKLETANSSIQKDVLKKVTDAQDRGEDKDGTKDENTGPLVKEVTPQPISHNESPLPPPASPSASASTPIPVTSVEVFKAIPTTSFQSTTISGDLASHNALTITNEDGYDDDDDNEIDNNKVDDHDHNDNEDDDDDDDFILAPIRLTSRMAS